MLETRLLSRKQVANVHAAWRQEGFTDSQLDCALLMMTTVSLDEEPTVAQHEDGEAKAGGEEFGRWEVGGVEEVEMRRRVEFHGIGWEARSRATESRLEPSQALDIDAVGAMLPL